MSETRFSPVTCLTATEFISDTLTSIFFVTCLTATGFTSDTLTLTSETLTLTSDTLTLTSILFVGVACFVSDTALASFGTDFFFF